MAPKKKKKVTDTTPKRKEKSKQSDWVHCSLCGKLFSSQDVDRHTAACDSDHGYIKENVMHGKVINVECLVSKDGTSFYKTIADYNSVVWISIQAMQVCGFVTGQFCIVNQTLVKRIWPHWSYPSCSVAMTEETLKELNAQKGDYVTLERFSPQKNTASIVELLLEDAKPCFTTDFFSAFVSAYLNGRYITNGTPINIHYFGSVCFGTASNIQGALNTEATPKSIDPRLTTSLKEAEQTFCDESPDFQSLSEDDISSVSAQDISLSLRSLDISNGSLDESNLSVESPSVITPYHPFLHKAMNDTLSSVKFYQVSSLMTKFTLVTKNVTSQPKKSIITLKDIAGLDNQIKELKDKIVLAKDANTPSSCILLHGPSGTGKTVLIKALAHDLGLPIFYITEADAVSRNNENILSKIFNKARHRAPSILVINDIDLVCPNTTSGQQGQKVLATVTSLIDKFMKESASVTIIGITNKIDDVHPALTKGSRFDCEVEVSVPSATQRLEILSLMMNKVQNDLIQEQLEQVAFNTHGYVGADIGTLIFEAASIAISRNSVDSNIVVTFNDLTSAMGKIKPHALKEIQFEVPQVRWLDIGGMSEVKFKLQEALELHQTDPALLANLDITPPRGLLMYGPPGCSKTMVAKALATESSFNFFAVKGPEIFNKYVGESERTLREIFRKAKIAAPSIIFFDEIDAIASKRGSQGGSDVDDRVLTQLLTEIDGFEDLKDVFIIAATNRPDTIDQALLRPGRFNYLVYVPLPDSQTRKEIFEKKVGRMSHASDIQIDLLVELTQGYSGAEIIQVCQEAALCALKEDIENPNVRKKHFDIAIEKVQPRVDTQILKIYQNFSV